MAERATLQISSIHLRWRIKLLDALRDFKLAGAATTKAELDEVSEELTANIDQLPATDKPVLEVMKCLVIGFAQLCEWASRSLSGENNAMQFLTASHGQAIVAAENLSSTRHTIFANAACDVVSELRSINSLGANISLTRFITTAHRVESRIGSFSRYHRSISNKGGF